MTYVTLLLAQRGARIPPLFGGSPDESRDRVSRHSIGGLFLCLKFGDDMLVGETTIEVLRVRLPFLVVPDESCHCIG